VFQQFIQSLFIHQEFSTTKGFFNKTVVTNLKNVLMHKLHVLCRMFAMEQRVFLNSGTI
jgi:hypothetical protein